MKIGVIVLNFGEPENPTPEEVIPFLERIFFNNANLEGEVTPEEARRRSRELAERRAPGLIQEYNEMGPSPLNPQARAQAEALQTELRGRGHDATTYSAMQFTEPLIQDAVKQAQEDGVELLVGLPVYPLCGASTTVAALDAVERALEEISWPGVEFRGVTGWHRHPLYTRLRADGVREAARDAGVELANPRTTLLFSAHGTPIKYLKEGNRYQEYVEESCRAVAEELGVSDYVIGYQNHTNRGIEWTQPDVEQVIQELDTDAVVVVPISFMHEQSETLAELDHELREEAEEVGLKFVRVPVPHDDPRFPRVLADLVEPLALADEGATPRAGELRWGRCRCRPRTGSYCLNAPALETAASPASS